MFGFQVPLLPRFAVHAFDSINGYPRSGILFMLSLMSMSQVFRSPVPSNLEFDYVIVGGGLAGCVVASRLSEDPSVRVLLIEAGGEGNVLTRLPIGTFYLWDSVFDWKYHSVPQEYTAQYLNNRQVKLTAGKILGGGSMLNTILWVRGTRQDYQRWQDMGITGWSYEENLPYYMKSESANMDSLKNSKTRGRSGPITINYESFQSPYAQDMINAGGAKGYRTDYDYNDGQRLGFSRAQSDLYLGQRVDAARGYIDPIRDQRSNLYVLTQAVATKVLFHGKTAVGVEFEKRGTRYTAYARREVIVAAGGIGSPKLMLLSGVGPADHLNAMGIPQVHELAVGKNLQDHVGTLSPSWSLEGNQLIDLGRGFAPSNVSMDSPMGGFSNTIDWTAFINTKSGPNDPLDQPDIQLMGVEFGVQTDFGTFGWRDFNYRRDVWEDTYGRLYGKSTPTVIVLTILLDYNTTGEVRLQSRDPNDQPIIDIQYLSQDEERKTLMSGVKFVREMFASEQMKTWNPKFMNVQVPNCSHPNDVNNDDYMECLALGFPTTIFHYSCTMRMGADNDPEAVVDNQLRMRGLDRIRVVDTSVLPFLPTANPQASNYMVAEKAADIIKGHGLLPPVYAQ